MTLTSCVCASFHVWEKRGWCNEWRKGGEGEEGRDVWRAGRVWDDAALAEEEDGTLRSQICLFLQIPLWAISVSVKTIFCEIQKKKEKKKELFRDKVRDVQTAFDEKHWLPSLWISISLSLSLCCDSWVRLAQLRVYFSSVPPSSCSCLKKSPSQKRQSACFPLKNNIRR